MASCGGGPGGPFKTGKESFSFGYPASGDFVLKCDNPAAERAAYLTLASLEIPVTIGTNPLNGARLTILGYPPDILHLYKKITEMS